MIAGEIRYSRGYPGLLPGKGRSSIIIWYTGNSHLHKVLHDFVLCSRDHPKETEMMKNGLIFSFKLVFHMTLSNGGKVSELI